MIKNFDFIISGGGLVGCVVASELSRMKFKCCLIEKNKFSTRRTTGDISPLSLNYRSKIILNKFKLWELLAKNNNPINTLTIKHFNNLNRVHFYSKDINLPQLGYIFNRQILENTLRENVINNKNITVLDNTKVIDTDCNKLQNKITLSRKNTVISSKYVIACDSPESKLVNLVSGSVDAIDYNQTSLIISANGNFTENHALQFFCKFGVLALLPHNKNQASLVLTVKDEYLSKFISDDYLNKSLISDLFKNFSENLVLKSVVGKYKMKTSRAKSLIKNNVILLGNSSHLIHTIGAQGYNLALRNIESLTDHLMNTKKNSKSSLDNLVSIFEKDRNEVFDNIDFALGMFTNNSLLSKFLSKSLIMSMKLNSSMKNDFLKRITGLNKYPYLSVEQL